MAKKFKESECIIPQIWCGDASTPPKKKGTIYSRTGTRYECLKQGFGAGTHTERKNYLPAKSVQQIKYIGPEHEKNFKAAGIKTTTDLIKQTSSKTSSQIEILLKRILVKSNGVLDGKSYNCVVLYLYQHGVANVPACKKIK